MRGDGPSPARAAALWAIASYHNPRSIAYRFRKRRASFLCRMIADIHRAKERVRILDAGGSRNYWRIIGDDFLERHDCRIDVLNLNLCREKRDGLFRLIPGDARAIACEDGAYDLYHANSVIEHMGRWEDMVRFAGEARRVAAAYYVQTPNFWFPIEPHYLLPLMHWLPPQLRAALMTRVRLGRYDRQPDIAAATRVAEGDVLLTPRQMAHLFPDGTLRREKVLWMTKSIIMVREGA